MHFPEITELLKIVDAKLLFLFRTWTWAWGGGSRRRSTAPAKDKNINEVCKSEFSETADTSYQPNPDKNALHILYVSNLYHPEV